MSLLSNRQQTQWEQLTAVLILFVPCFLTVEKVSHLFFKIVDIHFANEASDDGIKKSETLLVFSVKSKQCLGKGVGTCCAIKVKRSFIHQGWI